MKYFHLPLINDQKPVGILKLNEESTALILQICKNLKISLQALHLSLWLFHCQVKLMNYHKFDRFVYICASVLVATKIGEHLRNPVDILYQIRSILRRKKNQKFEDSDDFIKKYLRKIFEAEVNIMINIGFDYDIDLSIQYVQQNLKNQLKNSNLTDKLRQTLTSLYRTQTVLYFDSEAIGITALDILMRNEGINVQLSEFTTDLVVKLKDQSVRQIKNFYLKNCILQ